jgi:hypothetical protein
VLPGDIAFAWTDWREDKLLGPIAALESRRTGPVRRRELAMRLRGRGGAAR